MQLREYAEFDWKAPSNYKQDTGPQKARKLMKAFDATYNRGLSKIKVSVRYKVAGAETKNYSSNFTVSEIDTRYPRADWLQTLINKGITIENFNEYASYLSKRHTLALLEDNPNLRQMDMFDIASTDDWETYKAAYIDKLANDHPIIREPVVRIKRNKQVRKHTKGQVGPSKEQVERAIEGSKQEVKSIKMQLEYIERT